jgi:hypothetical protein
MVGRIYPEFENSFPFVVDDFPIPDEWVRINILDPHDAIPFALSWAAIDFSGDIYIYAEFPFEDLDKIKRTSLSLVDYSRIIREREGRNTPELRIADPYFVNKRYVTDGKTLKEELQDIGLDYENGDTLGIETGHKKVREFLRFDKKRPVGPLNHPKLHIFKSCRNHWRSMLRYKKKFHKTGEVKDKILIDETFKHFADNIRHLLMRDDLKSLYRQKTYGDFDNLIGGGNNGGY